MLVVQGFRAWARKDGAEAVAVGFLGKKEKQKGTGQKQDLKADGAAQWKEYRTEAAWVIIGQWATDQATHSSILVWEIQWTEEAGALQSIALQRVGHGWAWAREYIFFSLFSFSIQV